MRTAWLGFAAALILATVATAQPRQESYRIFQFPADAIPRIDGDPADWGAVGDGYVVDTTQLAADDGSSRRPDPASLTVRVRVGWVKGLNRLFFLYEAEDDHWDFAGLDLGGDIFELVVDGDRSGGPLIARFHPELASRPGATPGPLAMSDEDAWFGFQNIHAQNYHIFTPPGERDWAMAWGPQADWIKRLPFANAAYRYDFRPGGRGRLTLEFWITPFDLASPDGPGRSIETKLEEDKVIAMSWAVIDRDGPAARSGFWNLSDAHTMYGQASQLRAFRLMPRDPPPRLAADWRFTMIDRDRRIVAFRDESRGSVTGWHWDFGDGGTSTEQHPVHRYARPGKYVVVLRASGPGGSARLAKVWDVSFVADPPK
ncbi:PKD domain-containing protein [Sphingomonas parva]|uniref:PKD domain-containing protein n=1 Tax=Sphingomonas parva TaxID=2555898 RepID=A0A4Y8ZQA8_9SPHN|nr:PKD domain-containing protein [Sphingomonas parva]TFI57657.1 PKD domain-containing protein [Sphingomonas parva]